MGIVGGENNRPPRDLVLRPSVHRHERLHNLAEADKASSFARCQKREPSSIQVPSQVLPRRRRRRNHPGNHAQVVLPSSKLWTRSSFLLLCWELLIMDIYIYIFLICFPMSRSRVPSWPMKSTALRRRPSFWRPTLSKLNTVTTIQQFTLKDASQMTNSSHNESLSNTSSPGERIISITQF